MAFNAWDGDTKSKAAERDLSIQNVKDKFVVNVRTGEILSRKTAQRADKVHRFNGYSRDEKAEYYQVSIRVKGEAVKIAAHRIVWAVANGRWPDPGKVIDHLDGDRKNIGIATLREVTQSENIISARR